MFDDILHPKTKTINVMLLDGGLGDHVCSLIAVDYMIEKYPWITPLVWLPDFLYDFAKHLLPEGTEVWKFSDMRGRYQPSRPTKTTKWDGNTSPMKIHLVDYAFLRLLDENPGIEHKNYLQIRPDEIDVSKFNLPARFIVLTTGYTADVREFPASEINKVARWAKDNGITPVFLGQEQTKTGVHHVIKGSFSEEIDLTLGIDLIDKTSLLEAARVMADSKAVLGVDNGLLHVAGCTQAEIIAGFTTVTPEIRAPIRHDSPEYRFLSVTPGADIKCRFCQENTNFLYGHDYRQCLYKPESPRNKACTKDMKAEKFIKHLSTILRK